MIAVLAGTILLPWATGSEVATSLPSGAIGQFFGDNFQRRTNQPLQAVTGDEQLAGLIALDSSRPHLLFDATPKRTPWLSREKFNQTGGVVVWRASDTVGTPPPDIIRHFPGLVPEVPQAFDRLVNGSRADLADRLGHRAAEDAVARSAYAAARALAMARRSCQLIRL